MLSWRWSGAWRDYARTGGRCAIRTRAALAHRPLVSNQAPYQLGQPSMADREGFELSRPCDPSVFETDAFNRTRPTILKLWCPTGDSNPEHPASEAGATTNCTSGACENCGGLPRTRTENHRLLRAPRLPIAPTGRREMWWSAQVTILTGQRRQLYRLPRILSGLPLRMERQYDERSRELNRLPSRELVRVRVMAFMLPRLCRGSRRA